MEAQKKNQEEYDLVELLDQTNQDLENLELDMGKSEEELAAELEKAGKELQKNFEELKKVMKKEFKSELINFYHDNKKLIDSDLKAMNHNIKLVLKEAKHELNEAMRSSKDPVERAVLQGMLFNVVDFSRLYNRRYRAMKLRLTLENAGVSVKNLFKK